MGAHFSELHLHNVQVWKSEGLTPVHIDKRLGTTNGAPSNIRTFQSINLRSHSLRADLICSSCRNHRVQGGDSHLQNGSVDYEWWASENPYFPEQSFAIAGREGRPNMQLLYDFVASRATSFIRTTGTHATNGAPAQTRTFQRIDSRSQSARADNRRSSGRHP